MSSRCLLVACLLAMGGAAAGAWMEVTDVVGSRPEGVAVATVGPRQSEYPRPPPLSVDANLLRDFGPAFNLMQDVSPDRPNTFTQTSDQYVATIPNAFVEGEDGIVYDQGGRVYHLPNQFYTRTSAVLPLPAHTPQQALASCERHGSLATVIQRYGHMYYHFLEEALPRVALLLEAAGGAWPAGLKLLTWGQPYEYQFLALMGVPREAVLAYDPLRVYCADTLLLPTPTPRVTPPREALAALRAALGVRVLPPAQRSKLVYVSRAAEPTRAVANEAALLAAITAAYPREEVVVFRGDGSALEAVRLFQAAKVVLGPHGAGLSNIAFAAPNTTVIEFLFMADPPLMFWHTAATLGQPYWLVPVPSAHWMQPSMEVPVDEVMDILARVLGPAPLPGACPPGTAGPGCAPCSPGSYAFNSGAQRCAACFQGRVAPAPGSAFCSTCRPGTHASRGGVACEACPPGSHSSLPGAWDAAQCLQPQQRRQELEASALSVDLLAKLSPVFARAAASRRLIQNSTAAPLSQQELCLVQRMAGLMGPYRGPYMLNATAIDCPETVAVASSPAITPAVPPTPEQAWPAPAPQPATALPTALPPTPGQAAPAPAPQPAAASPTALPPLAVRALAPTLAPALLPAAAPLAPAAAAPKPAQLATSARAAPAQPEGKKQVLDKFVIILLGVLGGIILIPLTALALRALVARRRRKQYKGVPSAPAAASPAPPGPASPTRFSNALFNPSSSAPSTPGSTSKPL